MKTTIKTLPEVSIDCTAKHTPGPWFRMDKRYSNNPELCIEICTFSEDGFPQQHIARVNHCDHNPTKEVADTVAANAKLIASAPDLLAALERVSMWQSEKINSGEMTMGELFNITFGMVNAAIAKAKGEK